MAVVLLKAAPEPEQIADRLDGGPWQGLELALGPQHVATDEALAAAIDAVRAGAGDVVVTAEAPVAWPSGAFVRVDRLDDEARAGIERSAEFASAIGSPVLTIHLFAPQSPDEYRGAGAVADDAVAEFLSFYSECCTARGVTPLIENVPPVLRMRTGGVYLSPLGGHWRDLVEWRRRILGLRFTLDTSHAALYRAFAAAYPSLLGVADDADLELDRYVAELAPHAEVAHVSDAHGLLGEGLPYGDGELALDATVKRLGECIPYLVAEINEPDHRRSPNMKAGYRAIVRALERPTAPPRRRPRRVATPAFDWQSVLERRDPVPSLLELQERFGGRRALITGGGGSIARALASFLDGFRPERVTLLDSHEASLAADRRARPESLERTNHVLCDIRDHGRLGDELAKARPDVVFHLAAYKHVDWAERYPEEFVDTNLQGSWNVLRAADAAGVDTVVVASTDKAALAASFYGRTKRLMEQLTAYAAREAGARRLAVRFVNVLGSAGSASELFLAQARAGVPLTVTDAAMIRYWITMGHTVVLAAHAALVAGDASVAAPAGAAQVTVGGLAQRIWRRAGHSGEPDLDLVGIRRGETLSEVLTGPGESLRETPHAAIALVDGPVPTTAPAWVAERLPAEGPRDAARAVWLEALQRPGLLAPVAR